MKRLLTSAMGCGAFLIASCVSLPANAATSGTIKGAATIPDTCSVLGNESIQLELQQDGSLSGNGPITLETTGVSTAFGLADPTVTLPAGLDAADYPATVAITDNGTIVAIADPRNNLTVSFQPTQPISGTYNALIVFPNPNNITFAPGRYEVTTTLTCIY